MTQPPTSGYTSFDAALVRRHYMAALCIAGALAIVSFVVMQLALLTHEFNLRLTALGAEQMSLFQRAGQQTRNLLQAASDSDATVEDIDRMRGQLLVTTTRLLHDHEELLHLDAQGLMGVIQTHIADPYYFSHPYELDRRLREFIRDAEFVAKTDVVALRQDYSDWAPVVLTMASNGSLLRGLDESITAFAAATSRHMLLSRYVLLALTVLTLTTLALESVWIFKPLVSRLQSEHEKISRSERKLNHLAHHDPLTGLPNRARFNEALAQRVAAAPARFGLIAVDLDDFKQVNDTLGHSGGDALLMEVARRLQKSLREGDIAARLGGDEFAVLVGPIDDAEELSAVAKRLHLELTQPVGDDGWSMQPRGSIGAALFPDDASTPGALLQRADMAMYAAKAQGRTGGSSVCVYALAPEPGALNPRAFDAELRAALERDELFVEYQPKCRLSDGAHVGFEALVRWQHPQRGRLAPDAFLACTERLQLMPQLTQAVLGSAARDIARWRALGFEPGAVAINMPDVMLANELAGPAIEKALTAHGLPWTALSVEVTEDVFLDRRSAGKVRGAVQALRERGMRISFDDFGTGYASLTHLRDFPFDEIKIDRSFIKALGAEPHCDVIVRALIQLGQGLHKTVVAEGVETAAQEAFLIEHGCDEVQGYRLARPMVFDAATRWLSERGAVLSARGQAHAT